MLKLVTSMTVPTISELTIRTVQNTFWPTPTFIHLPRSATRPVEYHQATTRGFGKSTVEISCLIASSSTAHRSGDWRCSSAALDTAVDVVVVMYGFGRSGGELSDTGIQFRVTGTGNGPLPIYSVSSNQRNYKSKRWRYPVPQKARKWQVAVALACEPVTASRNSLILPV